MRWILLIGFAVALQAGEMIATHDFARIEEEAEKLEGDALVLLDVDETLIMPDDAILKWRNRALFKQLTEGHKDRDLFRDIRFQASQSLVDCRTVPFVQKLQERKIRTMAFTLAPAKIRGMGPACDWRVNELKRYGFDFSSAFLGHPVLEFPKHPEQTHVPMFKSGVLFSSFHPKGDILIAFLQKVDWKPKKVLFIDDDVEFVKSVVASMDKEGIPCLGIHYTAANQAPCELNDEAVRFQMEYFLEHDIWLSDREAEELFQS